MKRHAPKSLTPFSEVLKHLEDRSDTPRGTPKRKPLSTINNSSPEKAEIITFNNIPEENIKSKTLPFVGFSDDEIQTHGLQYNAPHVATNRPQSDKKQYTTNQPRKTIEAFTNHRNELLIQNPMDPERFTVYPDIESYNRRSVLPKSRPRNEVTPDQLTPARIDPVSLTCSNS